MAPEATTHGVPTVTEADQSWQRFEIHSLLLEDGVPVQVTVPNVARTSHQLIRDAGLRPVGAMSSSPGKTVVVRAQKPEPCTMVEPSSEVELTYMLIAMEFRPVETETAKIDWGDRRYCHPIELPCDDPGITPLPVRIHFLR